VTPLAIPVPHVAAQPIRDLCATEIGEKWGDDGCEAGRISRRRLVMCGIVAIYSSSEPISAISLEKATLRLTHRGPDGERTWISADRRVGLGHARLSQHPFLTPPSALTPRERLHELVQETLRGPALASLPFYDQAKVVALLDTLPTLGEADRIAYEPVLMVLLSACNLQQSFKL
jgi:hypothetical protein